MNQVFSVSQMNQYIKNMFIREGCLQNVTIEGEVWGLKYHGSGHVYFTLKDKEASIACVMFAGSRRGLRFVLENGQKVFAVGNVGVYERDGKYQLYANRIFLEGAGVLYERLERLKKQLYAEGLFDPKAKKKIPKYVNTLGIVTADTGAVIQDIIQITNRRNPYVQLILYPVKVQGEGAAESIAHGIKVMDKENLDVMIVGRGGGSFEDLYAFNEEVVARAIYACGTPVISAVGHETDTTIADFVADLRAPTPSAAAELAVYPIMEFYSDLEERTKYLQRLMGSRLREYRQRVEQYAKQLKFASPMQKVYQKRQYLMEMENKAIKRMEHGIERDRHRLALSAERLQGLSPLKKLKGGFSYVQGEGGGALKSVKQVKEGERVTIILSDGNLAARVETVQTGKGMDAYGEEGGK